MRWTGDVSAGDWIAERLSRPGTVGGCIPAGFEAYARIFHLVEANRLVSTAASGTHVESRPFSWAELAAEKGTVWHGGMQWDAVVGKQFDGVDLADGWTARSPVLGRLDLERLAVVAGLLAQSTTTLETCVAGVWNGWGELHPGSGAVIVLGFAGAPDSADAREEEESFRRVMRDAVSPEVASAVLRGPFLELPQREYVLLEADVREFVDTSWTAASGLGWAGGFGGPTPNLLWPTDRVWFLASEIDFDSTLIGGSRSLIDAVVADPALEAAEVDPETDLTWRGDAVNPMPE